MVTSELDGQLQRLITGLADQEMNKGRIFKYDGGELYPDEVAIIMLPSILCKAHEVAGRCGMALGYHFYFAAANPVFPLHARRDTDDQSFFECAPFVMEVFEHQLLEHSSDLARFFEIAAILIQPGFSLENYTTYPSFST